MPEQGIQLSDTDLIISLAEQFDVERMLAEYDGLWDWLDEASKQ